MYISNWHDIWSHRTSTPRATFALLFTTGSIVMLSSFVYLPLSRLSIWKCHLLSTCRFWGTSRVFLRLVSWFCEINWTIYSLQKFYDGLGLPMAVWAETWCTDSDVDSPIHQTLACPKATSESRNDSVLSVCDLFMFEVSCMCGTWGFYDTEERASSYLNAIGISWFETTVPDCTFSILMMFKLFEAGHVLYNPEGNIETFIETHTVE